MASPNRQFVFFVAQEHFHQHQCFLRRSIYVCGATAPQVHEKGALNARLKVIPEIHKWLRIVCYVLVNALNLLSFVELSLTVDVLTHNHVEFLEVVASSTFPEVMCRMPHIFASQRICSNPASKYHQVDVYTLLGIQTASLLVENPYEQPTRGVVVLSQIPPDLLCTAVLLL